MTTTSVPVTAHQTNKTGKVAVTTAYCAAFVALGGTTSLLGPTLPGLAENTQTVLSEISFLFSAQALGYMLGSILGGRLYDRLPGHPVMIATLLSIAVMMALVPLVSILWLLTFVLLLAGIAEGTLDVGGNTLLMWTHRHHVGPFMNALHFFFGVGAFLSPIIVAQSMLITDDIAWAYWVFALVLLPIAVGLWRLRSPIIQTMTEDSPTQQTNALLVFLVALFFFLYVGAEVSFGGWIFTYVTELGLTSESSAAYLTSAFWGAITVGRLLAIPIAARFSPGRILLADLGGAMFSLGLIVFWSDSLIAAWIGTVGAGLFLASAFPTTLALAERKISITGKVTSWFFVGVSLGGMFLPWFIGQLFESVGPRVTMVAILLDLLVAIGVIVALNVYASNLNENNSGD
jgi:FHS family Na+ dependent glucose MFS transporter 1